MMRLLLTATIGILTTTTSAVAGELPLVPDPLKGHPPTLERVVPWLDTDDPDLQRALLELAGRHPSWAYEAARLLHTWLADERSLPQRESALAGLLHTFGRDEAVGRLIAETMTAGQTGRDVRLLLLRVLARVRLEPLPASWVECIGRALDDKDVVVRHEAVYTIKARDLGDLDGKLSLLSKQPELAVELRLVALEAVSSRPRPLPATDFALLTEQLGPDAGPLPRLAAARTLAASRLNAPQLRQLAGGIGGLDATAAVLLLPAFARSRDAALAGTLVDKLAGSPAEPFLTVNDLERVPLLQLDAVQVSAGRLRGRLAAREQEQRRYLAQIDRELPVGDAARGRHVFFSDRAACSTCHRAAGRGGGFAPNLSRIGFLRDRRQLLESIVLPSAYVAPEFRAFTVLTHDGRIVSGLIEQETSEALRLRAAPGTRSAVARLDIEAITLTRTSLMPEGIEKLLARQELSDLIEFLVTQR